MYFGQNILPKTKVCHVRQQADSIHTFRLKIGHPCIYNQIDSLLLAVVVEEVQWGHSALHGGQTFKEYVFVAEP